MDKKDNPRLHSGYCAYGSLKLKKSCCLDRGVFGNKKAHKRTVKRRMRQKVKSDIEAQIKG
jgi:hypothetical protein